jgi:hypothetical protein
MVEKPWYVKKNCRPKKTQMNRFVRQKSRRRPPPRPPSPRSCRLQSSSAASPSPGPKSAREQLRGEKKELAASPIQNRPEERPVLLPNQNE